MRDGRRSRRRRLWLCLAAFALLVVALACGRARQAGAWAIVQAPNYGRAAHPAPVPREVSRVVRAEVGPPAAVLEAWVLDPEREPRGTVLVLHGIRDQKSSMLGVGAAIRQRGMRAILVDLRGHGGSSGVFLTYGVVESRDLAQLVDQLDALGILEGPLGVYGPSYGGAVALHSIFASVRDVVPPYVRRNVPLIGALVPGAAIDAVVDEAGALGGFSPDAADTRRAVARTRAHVLLIHGEADEHIPYEHARALFAACPPGRCRLLPIPSADHPGALASPAARSAALDFLERHATREIAAGL